MTLPERIEYGSETEERIGQGPLLYVPRESDECPDCGVSKGKEHTIGCDTEQCPICSRQLIGCGHIRWVVREGNCYDCGEHVKYGVSSNNFLLCMNCESIVERPDAEVERWLEQ